MKPLASRAQNPKSLLEMLKLPDAMVMTDKRPIPPQLVAHAFKPGHAPAMKPRAERQAAAIEKRLTKALHVMSSMEAPPTFFVNGLEAFVFQGLSASEAIALRVVYCLATGQRYASTTALVELLNRTEGKVKLRVETAKADDTDEDFDLMTPAQIDEAIRDLVVKTATSHPDLLDEIAQHKQLASETAASIQQAREAAAPVLDATEVPDTAEPVVVESGE